MPLDTIASAISLIRFSLTLQANLFQLFQPIGGVLARPLSCACTLVQQAMKKTTAISVFIVFGTRIYRGHSQYHHAVAGGSVRVKTHPLPRGGTDCVQASLSKSD